MTIGIDAGLRRLPALRPGTFSVAMPGSGRRLVSGHHAESFADLSAADDALLLRLAAGFQPLPDDADDGGLLDRLRAGGWLRFGVHDGAELQYVLEPLRPPPPRREPPKDLVLSRFAVLHRDGDAMLLESPLAWCDVRLYTPTALGAFGRVAAGRPVDGLDELTVTIVADLWWCGLLVGRDTETAELASRQWSPHELWFHEHSRGGHRAYAHHGFGGTRWADGLFAALPARREPRFTGSRIPLEAADLVALGATDPPLTAVLEERSSVRVHDDANPLTVAELGCFLYRTARTRGIAAYESVEYKNRPYPSGGGVCELEIYPVVRSVDGLPSGMYHYDAEEHELVLVAEDGPETGRILRRARLSSRQSELPQVVLIVSARFGRLMWNYEAMAYALLLKHVGVLYQTMYLVATAMGLAACALGSGDSLHFGDATGIDPLIEDNVGEFMLGRPAAAAGR